MTRAIYRFLVVVITFLIPLSAMAQQDDVAWVQLEAHPSLSEATTRVRGYASNMQDVNGFSMGGGWYAIALGPYTRADAENVLAVYRAERLIPRDSYVTVSEDYVSQFWPVGTNLLRTAAPEQPEAPELVEETPAQLPDETPRQARQSESLLTRDERKQLQVYLQWAGYYRSAIDGAFGRGTRGAMARWQADNGYEATGVLTTRQREELRRQYYAVLEELDLRTVTSREAGIELLLPMAVLQEAGTEFPFVHYEASGDLPARVVLISQAGDQNTLFGLYDIMQTLEIVPPNGPRKRNENGFELTGENARIISHTEVSLRDGEIKGFTLVWPTGDEERRTRVLDEMRASFRRLDGVLDPAAGSNAAQNVDLVSGLEVRRPRLSRSGFFVDDRGTIVTTAEAVEACGRITVGEETEARVARVDETLGIAVLTPTDPLAPMSVATFREGDARLQSEVAVSGFSYEGVLGAPTMTFGRLADVRGLRGEENVKRLAMAALPGDAGGPVVDTGGAVLGMLLPRADEDGRKLPDGVSFAAGSDAIRAALEDSGVPVALAEGGAAMPPEDLSQYASRMTVLVSCWE